MKSAHVLLQGPSGGCLSILLKVWELHWRDWAGQDVLWCSMLLIIVRFPSLSVLH